MPQKAVFIDRDNTLIDDPGYLTHPDKLKLLPGVELALKSLSQAGFKLIVVTNQSGIARGMLTIQQLQTIHDTLRQQLQDKGAHIDAIYYCPFHPDGTVPEFAQESDLRKPKPGMLLKAAEQWHLDLASCWMVGDSPRDTAAGQAAGCRTIQVAPPNDHSEPGTPADAQLDAAPDFHARNLVEAARIIMRDGQVEGQARPASAPAATPATVTGMEMMSAAAADPEPQTDPEDDEYDLPESTLDNAETEDEDDPEEDAPPAETDSPAEEPVRPAFHLQRPEPKAEPLESLENPADTGADEHDRRIRQEILQHVRQMAHHAAHEDFSLLTLFGGLAQAIVGLFLIMTFYNIFSDAEDHWRAATVWGVIAMVFQVMSLNFFVMSKKSK